MKIVKVLYYFIHPSEVIEKIRWKIIKKKFASCGENSSMGKGFTINGAEYIDIGSNTYIGANGQISAYDSYQENSTGIIPHISIGNNVSIMACCHISCANCIVIGDGTLFGDNVFVTDNYHGSNVVEELSIPPINRKLCIKKPVIIGRNVWIGRNVCIMPGVSIGDGVVIGANAVVTKSIPSGCVVAGVPAKIIREIL